MYQNQNVQKILYLHYMIYSKKRGFLFGKQKIVPPQDTSSVIQKPQGSMLSLSTLFKNSKNHNLNKFII